MAFLVALDVVMNGPALPHRSPIRAGRVCGVFDSQACGILPAIFVRMDPLLGGKTGLVAVAIVSAPAAVEIVRGGRRRAAAAPGEPSAEALAAPVRGDPGPAGAAPEPRQDRRQGRRRASFAVP